MEFSYKLTGPGWAEARIGDDHHSVMLSASYLSDALGDLLLAVSSLQEGAVAAECAWEEEPGEYRWVFSVDEDGVMLSVIAFDDSWPVLPNEGGDVIFTTKASLKDVATAIVAGCRGVLDDEGERGYLKKWLEHPFPTELMALVSARTEGA